MKQFHCKVCGGLIYVPNPKPGVKTTCRCSHWEYSNSHRWEWLGHTRKFVLEQFCAHLQNMSKAISIENHIEYIDYKELYQAELNRMKNPELPLKPEDL